MYLATKPLVITVTSGKGGVGKTSLTANIATLLAKQGKQVLVLDADTGLANADVQLNLTPQKDLAHVLEGTCSLQDAVTPTPYGFGLIAGRSGHPGLSSLPLPVLTGWLATLSELTAPNNQPYDIILLDAPAGVAATTLALSARSNATLLVTTPDPSSLTDAYALIKLTTLTHGPQAFHLVVNQASATEGKTVHTRLTTAAQNFLQLPPLPLAAVIPSDKNFSSAVRLHKLATIAFPSSEAVKALEKLTNSPLFTT